MTDEDRDLIREAARAIAAPPPTGEAGEPGASFCGWKPLVSEALAVHPKQIKEAALSAQKRGVAVEFNSKGQPIFRCKKKYRDYLRAYKLHNCDSAYGYG